MRALTVRIFLAAITFALALPLASVRAQPAPVDRAGLFNQVVDLVTNRFYDPPQVTGKPWTDDVRAAREDILAAPTLPAAVARINRLFDTLKASHFQLHTPDDLSYYILADLTGGRTAARDVFWGTRPWFAGIGIFSAERDGKSFIDAIMEGSPASKSSLKVGDELVAVDGAPFHLIRSFRGKIGSEALITVRRTVEGPVETVAVEVQPISPLLAFEMATAASVRGIPHAGKRYGYVRIWALSDHEPIVQAIARLSPGGKLTLPTRESGGRAGTTTILSQGLTETTLDGLILDLRGKIGGYDQSETVLGLFETQRARFRFRSPRGANPEGSPAVRPFNGRIVMLIDHHTRSAGEMLALSFRRAGIGPLIGTTTAGHVLAAQTVSVAGNLLLQIPVSRPELDGEIIEGKGVAPDIVVENPLPYAGGRDLVLDAALERLAVMPAR